MQTDEMIRSMRTTIDAVAPGAKAFLFGSRARGDARADSDTQEERAASFNKTHKGCLF